MINQELSDSIELRKGVFVKKYIRIKPTKEELFRAEKCTACSGSRFYDDTHNGNPIPCEACSGTGLEHPTQEDIDKANAEFGKEGGFW